MYPIHLDSEPCRKDFLGGGGLGTVPLMGSQSASEDTKKLQTTVGGYATLVEHDAGTTELCSMANKKGAALEGLIYEGTFISILAKDDLEKAKRKTLLNAQMKRMENSSGAEAKAAVHPRILKEAWAIIMDM